MTVAIRETVAAALVNVHCYARLLCELMGAELFSTRHCAHHVSMATTENRKDASFSGDCVL